MVCLSLSHLRFAFTKTARCRPYLRPTVVAKTAAANILSFREFGFAEQITEGADFRLLLFYRFVIK